VARLSTYRKAKTLNEGAVCRIPLHLSAVILSYTTLDYKTTQLGQQEPPPMAGPACRKHGGNLESRSFWPKGIWKPL
jgi:hypothetical protein